MLLISSLGLAEVMAAEAVASDGTNTDSSTGTTDETAEGNNKSDKKDNQDNKDNKDNKDADNDNQAENSKDDGNSDNVNGTEERSENATGEVQDNQPAEAVNGGESENDPSQQQDQKPEGTDLQEEKEDEITEDSNESKPADNQSAVPADTKNSNIVDPNGEDNPLNPKDDESAEEDEDKDADEINAFDPVIEYYDPNFGTPLLYPLPKEYVITTQYSVIDELHPIGHNGIDYGAPYGTPILAAEEGTVIKAEYYGGYGNCVFIAHENGIETRYGHMSLLNVQVGDVVKRGQQIGLVGSTGHSTGPHLHFEVIFDGHFVNPILYLEDRCEAGFQTETINGVNITLDVEEGALPKEWQLVIKEATKVEKAKLETAIEKTGIIKDKVVRSYAFDIKVLDSHGNEVEPAAGTEVKLSFQLEEVKNQNLKVNVFHLDKESLSEKDFSKIKPKSLNVEKTEDVATVKVDGFSYYDLEFTQNTLRYELNRGGDIDFSEVLSKVDIKGDVSNVMVSDDSLVSIGKKAEKWFIKANKVFDSDEWMKITVDGVKYLIAMNESKFIELERTQGEPRTEIPA